MENFFSQKSQENGLVDKKKKDRKSKRDSQKNKRGDNKVESSDGPEIPRGRRGGGGGGGGGAFVQNTLYK